MVIPYDISKYFDLSKRRAALVATLKVHSCQRHYNYQNGAIRRDEMEKTRGTLLTHREIDKGCRDVAFEHPTESYSS
jgi:hypothetical protein